MSGKPTYQDLVARDKFVLGSGLVFLRVDSRFQTSPEQEHSRQNEQPGLTSQRNGEQRRKQVRVEKGCKQTEWINVRKVIDRLRDRRNYGHRNTAEPYQ